MRDLAHRPLACLTAAFAGGIALTSALGAWGLALVASVAAAGAAVCGFRRRGSLGGWAVLGAFAGLGGITFLVAQVPWETDVSRLPQGGQTIFGTVASPPRRAGEWQVFVLSAEGHQHAGQQEPVSGRLQVMLRSSRRVQRGDRWRLTGKLRPLRQAANPGQRSEAARLASLGVSGVLVVGSEELGEARGRGALGVIAGHAYRAQTSALACLERFVAGTYGELMAGVAASVVFGLHAAPPPKEITEVFRRAGTLHLLVVSGAMVSMVFAIVFLPGIVGLGWRRWEEERRSAWPLTGRGRVRLRPGACAAVVGMVIVTYYAVLTEGGQAVVRAAVMGVLIGLALLLRRVPAVARAHGLNVDHYTLLAIAALGILTLQPGSLFQPGFQLSFAAVLAILYLVPKLVWTLPWLPRWIAYLVAGTVAAQLGTFPLLVWHYGQAPVAGLGANLLAVPLASVVLVGAMATCAAGAVAPWAATAAGWITGLAARGLVWVSSVFAGLPGAAVEVRVGLTGVLLWYLALVLAGWGLGRLHPKVHSGS